MSTLSEKEKQDYLNQLFEFLELPSISADSRHNETMEQTAKWLSNQLINSGCDSSKIYSIPGFPFIGRSSLANTLVKGNNLVPRPANGIIACLII